MGKAKILIIETNTDIRELILAALRSPEFEFIEASDGQEGLEKATAEKPNLIIMDMMLPKVDGLRLCQKIRQNSELTSTPIIMLTAKNTAHEKQEGLLAGADEVISLPFDSKILRNAAERFVGTYTGERKILVVDDEESVRNILSSMLKREGYQVVAAASGDEALEKIKEENFSLVISDIRMPKMDGFGVLKGVKDINPDIPVIFVTAVGEKEIILQALKEGVSDYIEKPFRLDKVLKVVKEKLK